MKALLILLLLLLSGCKGLDFSNEETQLDLLHATTGSSAYDHWIKRK